LLRKSALYLNAHRFFVLGPTIFASVPNGARTWGLIASATGAGGIAGGLLVLRFHVSRPILAVQFAIALLATPLILLAIHSSTILLVLGSAMFGTDLAVVNILIQTSLQESIPNAVLSRVSSIYSLTTIGLGPIGFALSGYVAEAFGSENVLAVGACSHERQRPLDLTQCKTLWIPSMKTPYQDKSLRSAAAPRSLAHTGDCVRAPSSQSTNSSIKESGGGPCP
jgi:Transmembrane secretion effector